MRLFAHSALNTDSDTEGAAQQVASEIQIAFTGKRLAMLLLYASVEHDQEALIRCIRKLLPGVPLFGCSSAGLMGKGRFFEGGYSMGLMGIGGDATAAAVGHVEKFHQDTEAKAKALAQQLRAGLSSAPKIALLHLDPLIGGNMEAFARTFERELGCPVVGGGAGQPWGLFFETYQYCQDQVFSQGAVAAVLGGEFSYELAIHTGTVPTEWALTATRTDGNVLLELDGQPAAQWLMGILGRQDLSNFSTDYLTGYALGFDLPTDPTAGNDSSPHVVRAVFGVDEARQGLVLQASVAEGTRMVLHRRSVPLALAGSEEAARSLAQRLLGRTVRAVLGFECAGRTSPMLGRTESRNEQQLMQQHMNYPDAAWLGMLAWGELAPHGDQVTLHNYTYPMLVLAE